MDERSLSSRAFEALASPYRRQLLLALRVENPQADDDLDPLNLLEQREPTVDRDATRASLYHVHLPKLAEAGFIRWDRESGEISKGPEWEEIAPLLKLMDDHPDGLPDGWLSGSMSDD